MAYQWQQFTQVGDKFDDRISITKSEFIGLPREFVKRHGIKDFGYVKLFFDQSNKAIALKFVRSEQKVQEAYRVNHNSSGSASISAKSFLKYYRVEPTKYGGKYEVKVVEDPGLGQLFVIELKEHEVT